MDSATLEQQPQSYYQRRYLRFATGFAEAKGSSLPRALVAGVAAGITGAYIDKPELRSRSRSRSRSR
jgi:hypothetical protein